MVTSNSTYVWTADGAGTFKATRSGVVSVLDSGMSDYYGLPVALKSVASVAACQSEAGTYYTDGTSVWVHRRDGAIPTNASTIVTIGTSPFSPTLTNGAVLYVENLIFCGYVSGNGLRVIGTAGSARELFVANNCGFIGTSSNGFQAWDLLRAYLFKSQAAYGQLDGFNYSPDSTDGGQRAAVKASSLFVEYQCTAYHQGIETPGLGSNNASTAHHGSNILRVGHVGYETVGAVVHDVNGCFSVLYDCNVRTPVSTAGVKGKGNAMAFGSDSSAQPGQAWLYNCSASDADVALVVSSNTTVNLSHFKTTLPITNTGTLNYI